MSALTLLACSGRRASHTLTGQDQDDSLSVPADSLQAYSQPDCKADSSMAWVTEGVERTDSVPADSIIPVRRWKFSLADGSFPCFVRNDSVFIKAMEVDWQGHFYVVGGNPARLVCYRGTTPVYSRELDSYQSNNALIRLDGDSLWIVEESLKTIIRLHKSGQGDIERFPIPFEDDGIMFVTGYTPGSGEVEIMAFDLREMMPEGNMQ